MSIEQTGDTELNNGVEMENQKNRTGFGCNNSTRGKVSQQEDLGIEISEQLKSCEQLEAAYQHLVSSWDNQVLTS